MNTIPVMDDPLGKYWDQPADMTAVPFDQTHAILTPRQFKELPEYNTTRPTGVYPGKCWKALDREETWHLCWWGEDKGDGMLQNFLREILIVDDAPQSVSLQEVMP